MDMDGKSDVENRKLKSVELAVLLSMFFTSVEWRETPLNWNAPRKTGQNNKRTTDKTNFSCMSFSEINIELRLLFYLV